MPMTFGLAVYVIPGVELRVILVVSYQSTDSMAFPSLSSAMALSWQRLGSSAAICLASAFLDIPMASCVPQLVFSFYEVVV